MRRTRLRPGRDPRARTRSTSRCPTTRGRRSPRSPRGSRPCRASRPCCRSRPRSCIDDGAGDGVGRPCADVARQFELPGRDCGTAPIHAGRRFDDPRSPALPGRPGPRRPPADPADVDRRRRSTSALVERSLTSASPTGPAAVHHRTRARSRRPRAAVADQVLRGRPTAPRRPGSSVRTAVMRRRSRPRTSASADEDRATSRIFEEFGRVVGLGLIGVAGPRRVQPGGRGDDR